MDENARKLIEAQRRRKVAELLGYMDQHVKPHLDAEVYGELRRRAMAAVDTMADLAVDLLRSYSISQADVNLAVLTRLEGLVRVQESRG